MRKMPSRNQFIREMKAGLQKLERGDGFVMHLQNADIYACGTFGDMVVPLADGVDIQIRMYKKNEDDKKEDVIPKSECLEYNNETENLIEISLAYANLVAKYPQLTSIESTTWKTYFVDWANEFENVYPTICWDSDDYLEKIESFAAEKILGYAGIECKQEEEPA